MPYEYVHFTGDTAPLHGGAHERPCIMFGFSDELKMFTVAQYAAVLSKGDDQPVWALNALPVERLKIDDTGPWGIRIIDPMAYETQMINRLGLD